MNSILTCDMSCNGPRQYLSNTDTINTYCSTSTTDSWWNSNYNTISVPSAVESSIALCNSEIDNMQSHIRCLESENASMKSLIDSLRKQILRMQTQVNILLADKQVREFNEKNN